MTVAPLTPRERAVARSAYTRALLDGQFCDETQAVFRASVAFPEPKVERVPAHECDRCDEFYGVRP